MSRIGSITFEWPGEGDHSLAQTIDEVLEDIRRYLQRTVGETVVSFGKLGKKAANRVGEVLKLFSSYANGTAKQASGTFRRSVMRFDELNRLTKNTGVGTVLKQNNALVESVQTLFGKLKKMGGTFHEYVVDPVLTWGKENALETVTRIQEAFRKVTQTGKDELEDFSTVWDQLTDRTFLWTGLMGQTDGAAQTVGQSLRDCAVDAVRMAQEIRSLGQESATTVGQMQGLGAAAQAGMMGVTSAWQNCDHWFEQKVTQPVSRVFNSLWSSMKLDAGFSWEGVKGLFSDAGGFFESTFSDAWGKVRKVFSNTGEVNTQIQSGVLTGFKTTVNGLIDGINRVVTIPFLGINDVLNKLQNIKVGNVQPFSLLTWRISAPEIPHLARGAVLPANKPFLAMVGDQRHGTNVEAPLTTIQEALALVMEDYRDANLAGHAATVEVLREILQAVLGIQIGDEVIASAYDRYQSKMSVVKGR